MDDSDEIIAFANKITPYSMLIDFFIEMTNHLEGHCTMDDINEISAYLNFKIVEAKKKAVDN